MCIIVLLLAKEDSLSSCWFTVGGGRIGLGGGAAVEVEGLSSLALANLQHLGVRP